MHRGVVFVVLIFAFVSAYKVREDKTKCPRVKALRNFDLHELMGLWYVVEYYASSEEMPEYCCMRAKFTVSPENFAISMKFNYSFIDDPEREKLSGNITWQIPDFHQPAHWVHAEDTYEGIYNTYVLDSDYNTFGLLLHCAEKSGSTRYLSSLVLSREPTLKVNIINYLREKLPRYGIDVQYMFSVGQKNCQEDTSSSSSSSSMSRNKKKSGKNHPLKRLPKEVPSLSGTLEAPCLLPNSSPTGRALVSSRQNNALPRRGGLNTSRKPLQELNYSSS